MLNSLYKYLVLNNHVSIPGIGSFQVQTTTAAIQHDVIQAPETNIIFHQGTALTEKNFYDFLAAENDLDEVEAIRKFQDFAYNLRNRIQSDTEIELQGLGWLKKTAAGDIAFEPAVSVNTFFPAISLQELSPTPLNTTMQEGQETHEAETLAGETTEEAIKKDPWVTWALILAVVAMAAIAYYFMVHGMY